MTAFYVIAALMLLVALTFVLLPLLRPRRGKTQTITDTASNVAIFRAYKRELDEDFERGAISDAERDAAVADLGTRVLAEVPADAPMMVPGAPIKNQRMVLLAGGLSLALVIAASAMYRTLGSPNAIGQDATTSAVAPHADFAADGTGGAAPGPAMGAPGAPGAAPGQQVMTDQQILAMVDGLAKKMEANPNDPKGWVLLARSQNAMGRFPQAAQAFARAVALTPNDAQLIADYADVQAMAQGGNFAGKPLELIQRALKVDPNNMKALALAGTVEIKANNRDGALKYWQKLRGLVAPNSDDSREIDNIIADVKSGKAMRGPVVASNSATDFSDAPNPHAGVAGAPQTTTGGPSGAPAAPPSASAPPAAPAPAAGSARVTGLVLLDPALISKVTGNETLFVFARAVNGPKMPLAVLRVPVPTKWPFVFELTDAMAMAPGMNLSSFPQVTIDARISKSGNAIPAPGDLAGQSAPITPRTLNVPVNISRVVP